MKIYALMMTYGQMDWLPWSIKQFNKALEFGSIDKVLIAEGGHSKKVKARSPDGSWEYLNDTIGNDIRYEIFDSEPFRKKSGGYSQVQFKLLNHMCSMIPADDESWIWCIHDDLFFFDSFLKSIRNRVINLNNKGKIMFVPNEMCFTFNFRLYLERKKNYMLFKWPNGARWRPITTPCYADNKPIMLKKDKVVFNNNPTNTAFHFKFVKRPGREKYRHAVLAAEAGASKSMIWHNQVWMKADLSNLEQAYKICKSIYGKPGFEVRVMGKKTYQKLKGYNGPYPEVLLDHPYVGIDDVREIK